MRNILNGEWYKWKKNKAFWICLLSAVGMILLVYLTMTAAGQAMGAGGDVLQETGISGMAEQFAGGGLVTMFSAIFLCIWVISDYTHGAMKNVVGKGYSRVQVFLAKHLFGTLITTLMNLVIFLVILIIGLILIGTQHVGSLFFKNLFLYFGLQLLFGVAVSSIVIAVCEWSRNMAAGIGITMALIIFSPLVIQGLDLLFSAMQLKITISGYWILNLMADCPTEAFTSEFLFHEIVISVIWTLLPFVLGTAHFCKADIE